ncbi:MAG TPA: MHYT domain-containing protein [Micromonosporaceae bacterium]|nr:MHYT domain-containing protein [Micromonosporaceae bacterium]
MHVNHFSYGLLTPLLSYTLSVLGCLLGLICTVRARNASDNARRGRWLLLAAWAIGGTGIWVMHFMAMIGFSIPGVSIRYDIALTAASWITAVVVVAVGLFIVGFGRPLAIKIILAGIITGVGVAAMHYTGMAAMRIPATVTYDRNLVAASVAIAVVAATVALWFTVTLRRGWVLMIAALIMGVAVNGMHFTGMYAMRVSDLRFEPVSGILPVAFLAPIVVFVVAVLVVLMVALLNRSGSGDETRRPPRVEAEPARPNFFTPRAVQGPLADS